jgi:hypothetical protein
MTDTAMTCERVKAHVIAALTAAGFTVTEDHRGKLDVRKDRLVLGDVDFSGLYPSTTGALRGEIAFDPASRWRRSGGRARHGRYGLAADGTPALSSLLKRLAREHVLATADYADGIAANLRDRNDKALENLLLGGPRDEDADRDTRLPAGVSSFEVFEGAVSFRLSNLTPERAAMVLAVLKAHA